MVISGGRPALTERKTARLLPALRGVTADPVWLVRDDRAPEYERDEWELATFPREAAEVYAAQHWTALEPYRPGAFLGGFTEREWACRLAEERGYWAVLQLDDNLLELRLFSDSAMSRQFTDEHGGLSVYADLLAAVTLSTNSVMTGARLSSVAPAGQLRPRLLARPGFPYSLFLERTGPSREKWHGPYEDDILHAYQYAVNPAPVTAALVMPLLYYKVHGGKTGMRAHYGHDRAAGLQRAAPEIASIQVIARHSNGRGQPRVFHKMRTGAIAARAPLIITDRDLYAAAVTRTNQLAAERAVQFRDWSVARVKARAARWDQGWDGE